MEELALRNQPCYDKEGNMLGWYSRSVAVAGFIFCRDNFGKIYFLACKRGKGTPDYQGYWNCPCGYLDFDETTKEACCREVKEETGIDISPNILRFFKIDDKPSSNRQNVTILYYGVIKSNRIEELTFSKELNEKDEVDEIRWIPIDDISNYKFAFGHGKYLKDIWLSWEYSEN